MHLSALGPPLVPPRDPQWRASLMSAQSLNYLRSCGAEWDRSGKMFAAAGGGASSRGFSRGARLWLVASRELRRLG